MRINKRTRAFYFILLMRQSKQKGRERDGLNLKIYQKRVNGKRRANEDDPMVNSKVTSLGKLRPD